MTEICPVCSEEFTASVEGHAGRTKLCCSSVCKWKRINRLRKGQPVAESEYRAFCEKRKAERLANRQRAGSKPTAKPDAKPTADQSYEASIARVRAYLKLPARARWANRGMLTDTELLMAEQMWQNGHGGWEVRYNTILH